MTAEGGTPPGVSFGGARGVPRGARVSGLGPGTEARGSAFLEVREVSKRFGQTEALSSASLRATRGEFVSIVGPSGCGKSTLLEIVGGLQVPDQGEISIGEAAMRGPRDSTAIIFQETSTLPWRTVLENVAFALEVKGVPRPRRRDTARRLIERVGLSGFEAHYPAQLSGGMRQRVAIARGLTLDPDLILADEPFGALDEQTRLMLAFELLRLVDQLDCTTLFITHSIQESVLLSDRVLVMSARPGHIIEEITIPLPRPRSSDLLGSAEVAGLMDRVWTVLKGEALTAMKGELND